MRKPIMAAAVALISLAGCASKDDIIPKSEKTGAEVYYEFMGQQEGRDLRIYTTPQIMGASPNLDAYVLHNTPNPGYQLLPNPTLYLFVPAHMSARDRVPVPAYITEFKMFERDEYALPGEVMANMGGVNRGASQGGDMNRYRK